MTAKSAATNKAPGFAKHPGYEIRFEPCAKRLRVIFGGETLADTTAVRLLHETRHLPVYYFPRADVRLDLLTPSEHRSHCPFKGEASYWTVAAGGKTAENAVWGYAAPYDEVAEIRDYLSFYWNKMDHWYEEDEEVFVHARDPYVRVDVLDCARPLRVVLGGETVAETRRARILFETGLPPRYYIPREDVSAALLPSDTETACPYKGRARYHGIRIGDETFEDIVWYYGEPLPESSRIADRLCFFNEKVDAILLDGAEVPKPVTKWS